MLNLLMDLLDEYDDSDSSETEIRQEKRLLSHNASPINANEPCKKQKRGQVSFVLPCDLSKQQLFERQQPHVPGNWAGHVFINIPQNIDLEREQQRAANAWKDRLENEGWTGPMLLHKEDDRKLLKGIHVSLSRPFYLQRGSIDSFLQSLRERFKYTEKGWFRLDYSEKGTKLFTNDDSTRTFLVWRIEDVENTLTMLVKDVDTVLERYGAAPYYHPPQFHVSVASIPGTCSAIKVLDRKSDEPGVAIPVSDIHCTFGTTEEFIIPLGTAGLSLGKG
ncbi:hypothetical protein FisN_7Lu137 [Fistulifera solaris]|uniref:U6 snRNA phosphodiesterase 1 n=1 Tax=Fistulifera solaris TaxID=1519565 RepID=A0A1Z5JCL4_FISSO|nr:hypothetical protein FisN_7Lu137 [Fistulifera solaris]|eukprot:GAX11744.1 hypothetical protein FisN_7Lu137 [Fistulifera solaris]